MRRSSPFPAALAAAVLCSVLATGSARAALFVPTKTTDSADGACTAIDCSLREAVIAANAAVGSSVILLGPGIYTLSLPGVEDAAAAGDLDVSGELVIVGEGAASTVIDGGQLDRVLHVLAGGDLELRDLTLRNGRAAGNGGALLNEGGLTVQRTILTGNTAVSGAGGAGFGGAVHSTGEGATATLADSTVTGNAASAGGGGLAVAGELTLVNSTLHGNQSLSGPGGGIYAFSTSRLRVNNATIAGNTASGSGGGLFAEGAPFIGFAPEVSNSILAGNSAASHPDCSGPMSSGFVLIGDGTGCVGPSAVRGDLVGTAALPLDPQLGSLQEAGGPTPTRPPAPASLAVDGGSPAAPGSGGDACEATDQRGATRPGGTACDIGAVELTSACVAGGGVLCLQGGRFRVQARFATAAGAATSAAQGETLTADSGYFWFFDPANVEVTVKVLDGCGFNGHYWVFAAGMTNVQVELTVTDTQTGAVKSYLNPLDRRYRTVLDTRAFATCPGGS